MRAPSSRGPATRTDLSLSVRYVGLILLIVVVTGLVLGLGVTLSALGNATTERRQSLEYAASVVATSLLPVIADQDAQRIRARLTDIVETASVNEIECIEITDPSGEIIAESASGCTCEDIDEQLGLLATFTSPQVVRVPVEVDGFRVADVSVQFRPEGLERALVRPMGTTALLLGLAMLVSALWGGWMVLRTVVEPIDELRGAAAKIADGDRDIELDVDRRDEIGELARALKHMTGELQAKESELLTSYASLETAYNEKDELAQALERTMSMKSDFVAVASHEIRSPLTVIRLYAELLAEQEFDETDPRFGEALESMLRATDRLSTIVSGLLDVALLERGLMPLEYSFFDLGEVVEQAVVDAALLGARSGVEVRTADPLPRIELHGDVIRVRQVIDNLLSNAIKYSTEPAVVRVTLTTENTDAVISVADEGAGIAPEEIEKVFGLFNRGDMADNAKVAGLGLGLPISLRIARAHGGDLAYMANPDGRGSIFVLRLPLGDVSERTDSVSML